MLGNEQRLEGPVAIAGRGERQSPRFALHGLRRLAIAAIAARTLGFPRRFLLAVRDGFLRGAVLRLLGGSRAVGDLRAAAEMHVHFGVEHPLDHRLGHQPHHVAKFLLSGNGDAISLASSSALSRNIASMLTSPVKSPLASLEILPIFPS